MENGSNTATISGSSEYVDETPNGESIYLGDWIAWQRKGKDGWRLGQVNVDNTDEYYIECWAGTKHDVWGFRDFGWAVAEGRILSNSIKVIDTYRLFALHERGYM